jgi:hypothetical protein
MYNTPCPLEVSLQNRPCNDSKQREPPVCVLAPTYARFSTTNKITLWVFKLLFGPTFIQAFLVDDTHPVTCIILFKF